MKKINIVKSNIEFNNIINTGNVFKNKYFVIYLNKDIKDKYRFGVAIPKKIGKAVLRNKIKRQIKSIIDKNVEILLKKDYVIIARNMILDLNYNDIEKNLIEILNKIYKENKL
jgi:ribonuclease P protein component